VLVSRPRATVAAAALLCLLAALSLSSRVAEVLVGSAGVRPPSSRAAHGAMVARSRGGRAGAGPGDGVQRAAARLRRGAPLDLNAATAAELELLPGVGPALAARIVSHREAHGRFSRVDELTAVRGIGPRTLARLAHLLEVRDGSEPAEPGGASRP
jgi:competence protein ComEA